jgi:hypothetical protein
LFDAAMLAANVALVGSLTDLVTGAKGFHPLFGLLLLLAVALYAGGAWLKRRPLQARLGSVSRLPMPGGMYIVFLILFVMQWGLFACCLAYGLEILGETLGIACHQEAVKAILVMGGGLLPVLLSVWAILPPRHAASPEPVLARREAWADLALSAACVVFLVLWNGVFVESLSGAAAHHWLMRCLLVILISVPFAMFYLAPRALFLVDDYRLSEPWIGALLVMAPLAVRLVFG